MVSLGDFNSMLSQDDKYNGAHISSYEVSDFKECCTDLGLSNLNSTGCLFTWSHGHVCSKLDRVIANPFWFSTSHQAHVHFGTPSTFLTTPPFLFKLVHDQLAGTCGLIILNSWR